MTGKELIQELLRIPTEDLDREIKIYGLIDTYEINEVDSQYEFIESDIQVENSNDNKVIFIAKKSNANNNDYKGEEYMEIAFRMKVSDYKALPEGETEKMWEDKDNISNLNIVGQIIGLGRDRWITNKLELEG